MKHTYICIYLIFMGLLIGIFYNGYFYWGATTQIGAALIFMGGLSLVFEPLMKAFNGLRS